MDLKDLKSAWDTYSSQEMDKHRLGKDSIDELLKNQSKSLVERIDRNIRIGMLVLLGFVAYIILDDIYFSKLMIPGSVEYPAWLRPLDVFSNVLIVTTYLFFVLRYLRIKRSFSADTQLRDLLTGILDTIQTYRRMFYLAVIILLLNMLVSFVAGLYEGVRLSAGALAGGLENLPLSKIFFICVIGLAILIPLLAVTFYLLHKGFNQLYGRYMVKLNETLQELDEKDNGE